MKYLVKATRKAMSVGLVEEDQHIRIQKGEQKQRIGQ